MRNTMILLAVLVLMHGRVNAQTHNPSEVRSIPYAKLGYGGVSADAFRSAPAIGFGYRSELDSFALDISFLNYMLRLDGYESGRNVVVASLLRLQALHFFDAQADRSAYVGGGLSWTAMDVGPGASSASSVSGWHGSGLQGEFTAGYELTRKSPVRMFVEAGLGLPLFYTRAESYTFAGPPAGGMFRPTTIDKPYVPSAVISFGVGWQRHRP